MYKAMPPEQFKELMIAMLEYKYGDDSIVDNIQDPMVRALFLSEKVAIDKNEEKWEERKKINQENGSKGGRPKKVVEEEPIEIQESEPEKPKPEIDDRDFEFAPQEEEMRNIIPVSPAPNSKEETTSYGSIKKELGLNPKMEDVAEIIMRDHPTGSTRTIRVNQLGRHYGMNIKDLDIMCKQIHF